MPAGAGPTDTSWDAADTGVPVPGATRDDAFTPAFGDYTLIAKIASGGMGVVYKARHEKLNRVVALKMILAADYASPEERRRFYLEAEAAAQLDHPHIVPVYDVGEVAGRPYLAMGYVDGPSLKAAVADGPLAPREAARLAAEIAYAVQYAHEQGVIHRDLKPANILLDRAGRPRVTDFGLAKRVGADSGLTKTGQVMGTPSYMPPEQVNGGPDAVGPRADVYALGALLYHLLTGRPPFQAASALVTMSQVLKNDPVPPRRLNPQVPRDLEVVCLKCLEKEPRHRYPSAKAFGEDCDRYVAGVAVHARPLAWPIRAVRWCRHVDRIRDARVTLVFAGVLLILWNLLGIVELPSLDLIFGGPVPPEVKAAAKWWMGLCICWGLLLTYLGWQLDSGNKFPVWLGPMINTAALVWCFLVLFGLQPFSLGGLLSDTARTEIFMLLSVLQGGVTFIHFCAWAAVRHDQQDLEPPR